ncbi:MAG: hypothetical protein JOZ78_03150, partial [Chroococcidiopsidaceae cyanobacterium CP_BM_ER_R8_30]|nr:hypothetical protein [Chroococcidiopsidaceae cyanobacterium CP_BM_ER_R8_30]
MSSKVWTIRALLMLLLSLAVMAVIALGGKPEKPQTTIVAPNPATLTWNQFPNAHFPVGRVTHPQRSRRASVRTAKNVLKYRPNYKIAWVHPTNYGERYTNDVNGISLYNQSIIVLHETTNSAT